jgi:hypothetical protein
VYLYQSTISFIKKIYIVVSSYCEKKLFTVASHHVAGCPGI